MSVGLGKQVVGFGDWHVFGKQAMGFGGQQDLAVAGGHQVSGLL